MIPTNIWDVYLEDKYYTQLEEGKKIPPIQVEQQLLPTQLYPHQYLVCYHKDDERSPVLAKVSTGGEIKPVHSFTINTTSIKPLNIEQVFAINALLSKAPIVVLTGVSGSGKSLCSIATSLAMVHQKRFKRLLLTKPMSNVGRYDLGFLPGNEREKFFPYLLNYAHALEKVLGKAVRDEETLSMLGIDFVPIQLFRGASFEGTIVIADECQVLDPMTLLTIGTRISKGSKLIILGDLDQRDENIKKEETGLYKFVNSDTVRKSPLVAAVHLQRCERSEAAALFSEVFKES